MYPSMTGMLQSINTASNLAEAKRCNASAVESGLTRITETLQLRLDQQLVRRIVVDHQDRRQRTGRAGLGLRVCGRLGGRRLRQRKREVEGGTVPFRAHHGKPVAAQRLDDPVGDRQPQPAAAVGIGTGHLREGLQDSIDLLRGMPGPVSLTANRTRSGAVSVAADDISMSM